MLSLELAYPSLSSFFHPYLSYTSLKDTFTKEDLEDFRKL